MVEGMFIYYDGGKQKPVTDFIQNKFKLKWDWGVIVNKYMNTSTNVVDEIGDIHNNLQV